MFQDLKQELDDLPALSAKDELTMTHLLKLPDNLRAFLTWMMRQKVVQADAISQYIAQDFVTTMKFLGQLVKKGLIEQIQTESGEREFTVTVRSSRSFRIPDKIWKALDE